MVITKRIGSAPSRHFAPGRPDRLIDIEARRNASLWVNRLLLELKLHSGSTIAIPGSANAKWLFHQEKTTLQDVGKGT